MPDNPSILLIGGANNGKRLYVPSSHEHIIIPSGRTSEGIRTEQYDRQRICGNTQTFEIFVISGMSADKMIESLIDG